MISGKDLKVIAQNLGRFALSRETAKEPQDRVVVQADGVTLKVVAGAPYGTLVATVHATTQKFLAVISAHEFLTIIKTLKAKDQVQIIDLNKGWEVGCSLVKDDGTVLANFLRISRALPNIMLPPAVNSHSQGTLKLTGDELAELQIFEGIATSVEDNVDVRADNNESNIHFVACDRFGTHVTKWALRTFPNSDYHIWGTVYATFLTAVRGLGDATLDFNDDNKLVVQNDTYRAIGVYKPLSVDGTPLSVPWDAPNIKAVINRKEFIKSMRDTSEFDKHGRIGLQYDNTLQCVTFGEPATSQVLYNKMHEVLSSIPYKSVGIGLREGMMPVQVRIPNWIIEIAPVKPLEQN